MIKLTIAIIIFLAVAVAWLRAQWGRSRNKNVSKQIMEDLASGKHDIESYAGSFHILICAIPFTRPADAREVQQYLRALKNKKLGEKFTTEFGDMNAKFNGLLLGEGLVKELVHDRTVDVHYPCWLYMEKNEERNEWVFRSTFPENKEHHYLLEDLSRLIYSHSQQDGAESSRY